MEQILQSSLSFAPWADPRTRRLPGIVPVSVQDWLEVDSAFAGQMGVRGHLLETQPRDVLALHDSARPAAAELYDTILPLLPDLGYQVDAAQVTRPDGVTVPLRPKEPLATLGRLVQ